MQERGLRLPGSALRPDRALQLAFSLAPPLRSTGSAATEAALFARFLAASGRSDFSLALIVGYGLQPSRRRPNHDWRGRRWRSPGSRTKGFCACLGLRRRGVGMCLAISTPAVLPSVGTENISTELVLRRSIPRLHPCERLTSALADNPCITRGRYGSLHLHRDGLPPSTFCRSPGAPVHSIKSGPSAPVALGPSGSLFKALTHHLPSSDREPGGSAAADARRLALHVAQSTNIFAKVPRLRVQISRGIHYSSFLGSIATAAGFACRCSRPC
jgi:hypothetical protein